MMDCTEALTLLSGRVDGENTAEEERALQAHLDVCPNCRAILEAYQNIDKGVLELTEEPPEALARGVMEAVRRPVKRRRFYYGGGTLAAAAVIALLLSGAHQTPTDSAPARPVADLEESASIKARGAEARFAPADEPVLVEITDKAGAPVSERVALFAGLTAVAADAEYVVDAATAREIIGACTDYAVTVPDGFASLADDVPVTIRIVSAKPDE